MAADPYVEKVAGLVNKAMDKASDAESVETTIYYCSHAITMALMGILGQLTDILKVLQQRPR